MTNLQLGLKLGSPDMGYTDAIHALYERGVFQYIELFVVPESSEQTIAYWKQFHIPFGIHAPHSGAGMNPANPEMRSRNAPKILEALRFADALNADYIVFHSGTNGKIEESVRQLRPHMDSRCLVENKPYQGFKGDGVLCLGSTPEEIEHLTNKLNIRFCLDFGHAICAARSHKEEPLEYIQRFLKFKPRLYHLTDGDYQSELDSHEHYGQGSFPLRELLSLVPPGAKITNEARHDFKDCLDDFEKDSTFIRGI
jgi:endonuclease IV